MRSQSPSNPHQYHYSPTRHCPDVQTAEDKKVEKHCEESKEETAVKKITKNNCVYPSSPAKKNVVNIEISKSRSPKGETSDKHLKGNTSEKNRSLDKKDHMYPKVDSSEKKMQTEDKKKGLYDFI